MICTTYFCDSVYLFQCSFVFTTFNFTKNKLYFNILVKCGFFFHFSHSQPHLDSFIVLNIRSNPVLGKKISKDDETSQSLLFMDVWKMFAGETNIYF